MEELKRGMYVRTNNGIFKVYCIAPKEENYYKLILEQNERLSIGDSEFILKASYNIIDLIEVGDYVNGERIQFITNKKKLLSDGGYNILEKYTNIQSILTKEQFEREAYKI